MATSARSAVERGKGKRSESRARYLFRDKASVQSKGWNPKHPHAGGDYLEENEIIAHFPNIGLMQDRPDFVLTIGGAPCVAVEAKNERSKIDQAVQEAIDYANMVNRAGKYKIPIAIGFAGEADLGYEVRCRILVGKTWKPLKSAHNVELTAIPSRFEIERALANQDGTTSVTIPDQSEFIDAAKEMGAVLRQVAVEPAERPRVIGALVAAMYIGKIDIAEKRSLKSVNDLVKQAIDGIADITTQKKKALIDALRLDASAYKRLPAVIGRLTSILERLNIKAVLHTGVDFLGMFYEAFLRYGNDNNSLGIVFTPRHITRYCVDLIGVGVRDKVVDLASGTGGFLVAAFDSMRTQALKSNNKKILDIVRQALYGFDTNHQIWALASLNMFFRGDGKSHIEHGDSLTAANKKFVRGKFTRAFLNPPFSQAEAPEIDFIDGSMNALAPDGLLVAVVFSSVFASDEAKAWRKDFLQDHTLLGMISLPEDLFYPTAAPTTIMIAKGHGPQDENSNVFMAKIMDDGFMKLKGKRVRKTSEPSQLAEVCDAFHRFIAGKSFSSDLCGVVVGGNLLDGDEWCPEHWLVQSNALGSPGLDYEEQAITELFRAAAHFPDLTSTVLPKFGSTWRELPSLPYGTSKPLDDFFFIHNGRSAGEKSQPEGGTVPYISSGDATNSIVSLVDPESSEIFKEGGITITAFGQAALQPWPFVARGNGGSSVRVLVPRYKMSVRELIWFVAQINQQRWRYFYARMAIKSRLKSSNFQLKSPPAPMPDGKNSINSKLAAFTNVLRREAALW
jgi:hypothetical protein